MSDRQGDPSCNMVADILSCELFAVNSQIGCIYLKLYRHLTLTRLINNFRDSLPLSAPNCHRIISLPWSNISDFDLPCNVNAFFFDDLGHVYYSLCDGTVIFFIAGFT